MVSCDEPVPARELLLQSKLSNASLSELVASKTLGSGTLLAPAVAMTCSATSISILLTVLHTPYRQRAVTSSFDHVRLEPP